MLWISAATEKIGWVRATRNTPAATIVAAWMSADTGVGPSIASGSQVCRGTWPDLPIAPTNSSSAAAEDTAIPPRVVAAASDDSTPDSSRPWPWS